MTRKQKQARRMGKPRQTDDERRAIRADKALRELERIGFEVKALGAWQFYIAPKVEGAA